MDWSGEKMLQFLDIFETEPCLWDSRSKTYKSFSANDPAWNRIRQKLPFDSTIEELKRKKNSLLGYYRIHLNRYKKSLNSGKSYETNWFAFKKMHSFLGPVYMPKTEEAGSPADDGDDISDFERDCTGRNEKSNITYSERSSKDEYEQCSNDTSVDMDEYDHFGCLIAAKVRKISDNHEREVLMNSIQNLIFETYMKCERLRCS